MDVSKDMGVPPNHSVLLRFDGDLGISRLKKRAYAHKLPRNIETESEHAKR